MLQRLSIPFLFVSMATNAVWLEAAEFQNKKKLAITDISRVDEDFSLQGD